jgi:hypothetical protein
MRANARWWLRDWQCSRRVPISMLQLKHPHRERLPRCSTSAAAHYNGPSLYGTKPRPELQRAVDLGKIAVSVAAKAATLPAKHQERPRGAAMPPTPGIVLHRGN